ncbi:hypothetical protein [Eubacterium sp. 1001713B170207_170306_E7]|uniref:hypothetical protein n=1 Tax=Eubacterium sp. 1001713B170207_170306_E7 TaxID=2787097 RepID=UPI00189C4591|nr:hypothetical protein [Eubacterium sp. 1001713B170207_170306_E7]
MKKKRNILIIVAIIAIVAAIGSTMAAFVASTTTQKDVSTARLGIKIVQDRDQDAKVKDLETSSDSSASFQYVGVPGDTIGEKIAVQTDAGSKESYIRVTINRSWTDKDGKKDFKLSPEEIGILRDSSSWLVKEDPEEPEVIYCYYTKKVSGDTRTENVMDSFTILKDKVTESSNAYTGYSANITFEADAIQAEAADKAMLAEWGIDPKFDAAGNLTDYTEQ